MKKIIVGLLVMWAMGTSFLWAWKINLKPSPDASGKVAYGITCDNGKSIIVTHNTKQTYKPYFSKGHTYKTLNQAAQSACKKTVIKKTLYVNKGAIFCDKEQYINDMAKSEMKKAVMLLEPSKGMNDHCLQLRESLQVTEIKHYSPESYNKEFYDQGNGKRWTEKTKYNDSYYKVFDGKEYFYVLKTDTH